MWAAPPTIPLSPAVTSPFSRGTRDSSALTGTSSGRGGLRANDVRPYGGWGVGVGEVERLWKRGWWFNGLEKGTGDSSALSGTSSRRGGFGGMGFAPTVGGGLGLEKWKDCGKWGWMV